jgi:hypothetical protein
MPFGGFEAVFMVEGVFEGDGFVLEMVNDGGRECVELICAGEASGSLAQLADLED